MAMALIALALIVIGGAFFYFLLAGVTFVACAIFGITYHWLMPFALWGIIWGLHDLLGEKENADRV